MVISSAIANLFLLRTGSIDIRRAMLKSALSAVSCVFALNACGGSTPSPAGPPVERNVLCGTDKWCGLSGLDVIYPHSSPMYLRSVERVLGRNFAYSNVALGGEQCGASDVQSADWDDSPLAHWTAKVTLDEHYQGEFKLQLKAAIAGSLSKQAKADAKIDALIDRVASESTNATQNLDINVYRLNDDGLTKQKGACGPESKERRFARGVTVALLDASSRDELKKNLQANIEANAEIAASKENASVDVKANATAITNEVVEKAAKGLFFVVALGFYPQKS